MPRPRKDSSSGTEAGEGAGCAAGGAAPGVVLIVSGDARGSGRLAAHVSQLFPEMKCQQAKGEVEARSMAAAASPVLALVDCELPDGCGFELAGEIGAGGKCAVIMITRRASLDMAMRGLRAGVSDLLPEAAARAGGEPLRESVARALARVAGVRRREDRIQRLTSVCRKLSESRREISSHVSGLCGDMVGAFQELADQVGHITIASEFKGLIRQELDVESLLRTALEYVLAKCGSTNAAVFLPSGNGEYSLGAYVNYDCPKDALDMMLEHLSGIVAPKMEHCEQLRVLSSDEELADLLGDDAHWLADCTAATFACRDRDECMAVVILFRDRRTPFSESAVSTLRTISTLFGQQLGRIVHMHHRHLPKEQWGTWGGMGLADEGDDDIDMAA
jgi:FixJ family two-component response regulator